MRTFSSLGVFDAATRLGSVDAASEALKCNPETVERGMRNAQEWAGGLSLAHTVRLYTEMDVLPDLPPEEAGPKPGQSLGRHLEYLSYGFNGDPTMVSTVLGVRRG